MNKQELDKKLSDIIRIKGNMGIGHLSIENSYNDDEEVLNLSFETWTINDTNLTIGDDYHEIVEIPLRIIKDVTMMGEWLVMSI